LSFKLGDLGWIGGRSKFGSDGAIGGRQRENVVDKRVRCARALEQGGKIAISVFGLQKS